MRRAALPGTRTGRSADVRGAARDGSHVRAADPRLPRGRRARLAVDRAARARARVPPDHHRADRRRPAGLLRERAAGRVRRRPGARLLPASALGRHAAGGDGAGGSESGVPVRLIGVGVGPGDPDQVTVQAVRVLTEADVVVVPVGDTGETGRAERTVRAHVDREVERLVFQLGADVARGPSWDAARARVAELLRAHRSVAFATIGDPNIYSTFSCLAQTVRTLVPEVEVGTV